MKFIYFIIFYLTFSVFLKAENLAQVSEKNLFKIRICYSRYLYAIPPSIDTYYAGVTSEIVFTDIPYQSDKWQSFLHGIRDFTVVDGNLLEPKWAFYLLNKKGEPLAIIYADAWCVDGWVDGKAVRYNGKLALWIRSYLTEAFDLKGDAIWSKDAKPSANKDNKTQIKSAHPPFIGE